MIRAAVLVLACAAVITALAYGARLAVPHPAPDRSCVTLIEPGGARDVCGLPVPSGQWDCVALGGRQRPAYACKPVEPYASPGAP